MNKDFNAINIFDFDGTLTTETWPKFWVWVQKFGYNGTERNNELENALANYRATHPGTHLETFFYFFHDLLIEHNATLSIQELMKGEKYIQYCFGLQQFLNDSISKNYIVSGGLRDFLKNLEIAKYFQGIYGTSLIRNEVNEITGIDEIMTDEKKILAIL